MKRIGLSMIRLYQSTWSKYTPSVCRFTPTCSQYTYEAIQKYGLFKGSYMGMRRIIRCNPFNPGGYDPVV